MNPQTRRWLLAPLRQLRTKRLIAQHGPTLPYPTAWALIALHSTSAEGHLLRAYTAENPAGPPGIHYDHWHTLSSTEQRRRRKWLHRHRHSPIQLLHLDPDLIKSTGLHILDWGPPPSR
ncbi:hypothetical protein [Streptomyces phaeochromogenes]|uniref:hypothetical protein n=1 Tax=Streptomyces phaeochromogenes TaxID=1923 RepID=UPI0037236CEF